MRGSTPPATYRLSLRESLFHGVQALRLTPLDSNVHGRSGLLAHTFMLGPRGNSNGCVSFRNYRAFLAGLPERRSPPVEGGERRLTEPADQALQPSSRDGGCWRQLSAATSIWSSAFTTASKINRIEA